MLKSTFYKYLAITPMFKNSQQGVKQIETELQYSI